MSILHVDLNSFYAHTAVLDSDGKHSFDTPLIVCGDPTKRHGIVLAATYPVKRHGVYAGMPVAEAIGRCPSAILEPANFTRYSELSDRFMKIVRTYSPVTMRFGIDEAYIDYNGCEHIFGSAEKVAYTIRERVYKEIGLTVSVGVGDNMIMAKMGSDYRKPNAVTLLNPESWKRLIWPLPVGNLMYVGRARGKKLKEIGIKHIGDLAAASPEMLKYKFGVSGRQLWEYANGIDSQRINIKNEAQKSVSHSTTLCEDVQGDALCAAMHHQTERVAYRMREMGVSTRLVGVHLRYANLEFESKQRALLISTDVTEEIYAVVRELVLSMNNRRAVRQVGVSLGRLSGGGEQVSLFFPERHEHQRKLDAAKDHLRDKYGFDVVKHMSTLRYVHTDKDDFSPFVRS